MSDHDHLMDLFQRYEAALQSGDSGACAACYAEDAEYVASAMAPVRGRAAIRDLQTAHPDDWAERFIDLYLGERLACDLDVSCALQSMTPDVMRSGEATRQRYEVVIRRIVKLVAGGITGPTSEASERMAIALLAMLSGGVTMARSLGSEAMRAAFARQLKDAAKHLLKSD